MSPADKFMLNKIKAFAREEQRILDRGGSCYGLNIWAEKRIEELEADVTRRDNAIIGLITLSRTRPL